MFHMSRPYKYENDQVHFPWPSTFSVVWVKYSSICQAFASIKKKCFVLLQKIHKPHGAGQTDHGVPWVFLYTDIGIRPVRYDHLELAIAFYLKGHVQDWVKLLLVLVTNLTPMDSQAFILQKKKQVYLHWVFFEKPACYCASCWNWLDLSRQHYPLYFYPYSITNWMNKKTIEQNITCI